MAASPTGSGSAMVLAPSSETELELTSVIYDMSQQVQNAMAEMLKMTSEMDQTSAGVTEEIGKCKEAAMERKKALDEEKEKFQKAAYSLLDILNRRH
ncbi:unnamed protein product [Linum tenue]|uniref:Polyamine-modulated factor 1-binding protein 1 n=1 Tax=Linum tenue TaxID=586396 RepID=A0AAV0M4T2_9ROSI|nr:unnamed protein product [Linum tenue]CAI0441551.1 unnamed protein product [Linum tenue]